MSTPAPAPNPPVPRSELVDVPDDPDDVFGAVIERNDLVCRQCYCRLRRRFEIESLTGDERHEISSYVDYELPEGYKWEWAERVYYETETIANRSLDAHHPDNDAAHPEDSACWNCGSIDTARTPRTRSKPDAVQAAANISMTLEEYDVAHDWFVLLARVKTFKSDPDMAGDDFGVFSAAVADAIRAHP